ncbi:chromate transporter [Synechococcus sp. CCY9201]|uniref:chromate transporter n=1 Tax=Synechococcus sp. CCY9201 TaxID=174697 RepID=UPI002B21C022|nr:chromate transporter [Synechococcus sp. CCY9201]MEA5475319.1 chromate transporter [Synechococcus sp. CCY9201]CAK6700880.1 Chromate transport protein [Synechococcus sp. CBW1107]
MGVPPEGVPLPAQDPADEDLALAPPPGLRALFSGMLQVALSSFGGGLSAWSQRIVVEQRRWMSNEAFITGLTVARLFPGPNQINMAIYIGTRFRGLPGALVALAGMLLVPFSLLMLVGLAYFQLHGLPAVDRVLAGVVAAAAGMALSMGFKILHTYLGDRMALLLAAVTFLALTLGHLRLVPVVLVLGPLAMAWYWPRPGTTPSGPP